MEWYHLISLVVVLPQLVFTFQVLNNYRYALRESRKERSVYSPKTVMIVPCKGLDTNFRDNIRSFLLQDYDNFLLWFVVAEEADPAYSVLCELQQEYAADSKAHDIRILIAGAAQGGGQKVHNMLHAYHQIDASIEVLAFADADACIHQQWLNHIVYPLRRSHIGVTSGYRWFVPKTNNLASLALSAVNAKIVQLLGNTRFNLAWGGSMAIRVDIFRQLGLDEVWPRALSDDLVVSRGVRQAGLKVTYVPACLAASVDRMTWAQLGEFAQRQFVITRIGAPGTWWFGLCSSMYSVFGLWGLAAGALLSQAARERQVFYGIAGAVFFMNQMLRAVLRQRMAGALLTRQRPQMKWAKVADVLFFWVWSILLLLFIVSSAFRRTITWRGIKYKMVSLTETTMLASESEDGGRQSASGR
jgi:cellulose synthase/poly-beta-1,6-N-acetylglucosamine synthase-like glycosyltransferase